jgi:hypothetical protein
MTSTGTINMNLIIPTVQSEPGPDYAIEINNDLIILDTHDHSSGKGAQITPAGMNINADLQTNNNNVTSVKALRFTSQATALSGGSDLNELYDKAGDLYYINSLGNSVQLTKGNAGARSKVINYFQSAVVGQTACAMVTPNMIQWNNATDQSGSVFQATSSGTGSAWINITEAGLYEISYNIVATGIPTSSPPYAFGIQQFSNATGSISNGTPILSSFSYLSTNQNTQQVAASTSYILSTAPCNIETWVTTLIGSSYGTNATGFMLSATGTRITVKQIG